MTAAFLHRPATRATPALLQLSASCRLAGKCTSHGRATLTAALDNPDGHALFRDHEARAEAEDKRRRAAEREAERPVCKRCGQKFTDQRWEETTAPRTAWKAGDVSVCGDCHASDVAREEAAAEAARLQAAMPPEPEHDQEPGKRRGLFRRSG